MGDDLMHVRPGLDAGRPPRLTGVGGADNAADVDVHVQDAAAANDDDSARPQVLVHEHIEPGTLIMVGIHTLRPETRIHRCRIIEGQERLEGLLL